jgi:hypothetical protein
MFGSKNENSYHILVRLHKSNNHVNLKYKKIKFSLKNTFTTNISISYFIINYTYSYKNIIDVYYIKYMPKVMIYFTNNRLILLKKQYSILLKSLREILLERNKQYE